VTVRRPAGPRRQAGRKLRAPRASAAGGRPAAGNGPADRAAAASPHPPAGATPRLFDVTICIDGASRGNPGRAAIGIVVLSGGEPVREIAERIGVATNNVAEYKALLRGLDEAAALGASTVHVQSDSELLVRQLLGQYKVRHDALVPLYREALAKMRRFEHMHVFHVPRARNAAADGLANQALDAET
jgi:ribonuclease HI